MKKILKILVLCLLVSNTAFSQTEKEKRARYILMNMHKDYITCYSFYKIGAEFIRKSNGNSNIIISIEKSSDISLKLIHETGELMGMTNDDMKKEVKYEMKSQLDEIDNNFNNTPKLLKKHAQKCKNLIENKNQRISFWKKKL